MTVRRATLEPERILIQGRVSPGFILPDQCTAICAVESSRVQVMHDRYSTARSDQSLWAAAVISIQNQCHSGSTDETTEACWEFKLAKHDRRTRAIRRF